MRNMITQPTNQTKVFFAKDAWKKRSFTLPGPFSTVIEATGGFHSWRTYHLNSKKKNFSKRTHFDLEC